jgi:hypothetical protein
MSAAERLRWLIARARHGDASALPELRVALDVNPWAWQGYGDLVRIVEQSWIELMAADDLHLRESLLRQVADLKKELGGPTPTAIERLLVVRAAVTFLMTQYYDARQAQARGLSAAQAKQLRLEQGAAQQRHLQALRALSTHQKFLAPPRTAPAARKPLPPDTPRFSGGQHDTDPLVHGIGVLN